MPIYDFACRRCAHSFELLVKSGESPSCPACGAKQVERAFPSSAAVSTTRSRDRALTGARRKAGAVKKEKDHAHAQYMREHIKDHGG